MKKLFFILSMLMSTSVLYSQNCYSVSKVENLTENPDLSSKKFVFGLKQLTEELMGEKYTICEDGLPVNVAITSIESPTVGINIGPFMIKKKNTIVKVIVVKDGVEYSGEGSAKLSVKASFAELRDENLPFEKSTFASAVKKALELSISNM
jgi:hypothetical protein